MKKILLGVGLAAALSTTAFADSTTYEVTIVNLTKTGAPDYGQVFAPFVLATHRPGVNIFVPGEAASAELEELAETGSPAGLITVLSSNGKVSHVETTAGHPDLPAPGLLPPGHSVTVTIKASRRAKLLSLAGMLVTTNDGFAGRNGVALPTGRSQAVYYVPAWDAGTEKNDELCTHIPGPPCPPDPELIDNGTDENGVVHIHNGIHGIDGGDLHPEARDWRNPVAVVYISRVGGGKRDHDDDDD